MSVSVSQALFTAYIILWFPVCYDVASAEPKKVEDAKPGNCEVCHGEQKVLPGAHVKTEEMTLTKCAVCHRSSADTKKPSNLRATMTLSHAHLLSRIACSDCHGNERPAVSPDGQKCLVCHANHKKIALSEDKALPNPHDSHMGDLDCLLCHHVHARSENFCVQCHWWKYLVP